MNLVRMSRKSTVETISKQLRRLHYEGPLSYTNNIVLNLNRLYSLVPFSSLVL